MPAKQPPRAAEHKQEDCSGQSLLQCFNAGSSLPATNRTIHQNSDITKREESNSTVRLESNEGHNGKAPRRRLPARSCSVSTSESESSIDDNTVPVFFDVRVSNKGLPTVEQDLIQARCLRLRKEMRDRVTLPLFAATRTEVESGVALPIYSCPYKDCDLSFNDRCLFLHHVCGCLLYTSPSPRDRTRSRMPSSA